MRIISIISNAVSCGQYLGIGQVGYICYLKQPLFIVLTKHLYFILG